jgi:uncharacterized protein YbaP (TraB family)
MRTVFPRCMRAVAALAMALLVARADIARAGSPEPAPTPAGSGLHVAIKQAHPAMWTVYGRKGKVYLLGSIHVLPPDMQWRTREIDAAIKASDVFIFEVLFDAIQTSETQAFIRDNGLLPAGTALPSLLDDQTRKDYIAALNLTHLPPNALTSMRPWLALVTLEVGLFTTQGLSADTGLERQVYKIALRKKHVSFQALETPVQQIRLLMPEDKSLELQEFDSGLKDILNEKLSINDLIDAWARGDVATLNDLMKSGFKDNPKAEKALFEDRNRAWVAKIEDILQQRHVYFVTVGAGHLAGPKGVPALLRAEGYKVSGP